MITEIICGTVTIVTVSSLLFAKWAMKFQFYSSPEEIERQRIYDDEMSYKEEQEKLRKEEELKAQQIKENIKLPRCPSLKWEHGANIRCQLDNKHFGPHKALVGMAGFEKEKWWE